MMLINSFFQSVSTRTAGLNPIDLTQLSIATNFLPGLCMDISTSPTVVVMRSTADEEVENRQSELQDELDTIIEEDEEN